MKKIIYIFLAVFTSTFSQVEILGSQITKEKLKAHIELLASDSLEGREVGKPGELMAAKYMSNYFSTIGIPPYKDSTYYQKIPLQEKKIKETTFKTNKKSYKHISDFYTFPNFGETQIQTNKIIFLGYGLDAENYSDYKTNVEGEVIMILNGEPKDNNGNYIISGSKEKSPNSSWRHKLNIAKKRGVKCVLFVNKNHNENYKMVEHKVEHPGVTLLGKEAPPAFFYISEDVANDILGKIKTEKIRKKIKQKKKTFNKEINLQIEMSVQIDENSFFGHNVLALIEGTDSILKNEIIVITAHYDHIGVIDGKIHNGADDNATGTAALLEIASAFQQAKDNGISFKRSVLFFPNSAEEKGLLGSYYYVENPAFPLENTIACLNVDMIGRTDKFHPKDSNYVYLIGSDKLSTDLHDISERSNKKYINMDIDYTFNDPNDPNRFYYRSDHYNFAKKNIPSIFYFSGVHEDYHKHTDTTEKLIYEKVEKTARLIFYTAWELSNSKERPRVNQVNEFKLDRH
ncbi:MAG: peptidase M28 [Flavobacteriales bacterium]|nr:peptidase M28 [Flavobacteriales bacterium]|tara:strand:+ start:16423 stop:17967 length:1545 start_codon:yes stop_codon:yes gene_type:complete